MTSPFDEISAYIDARDYVTFAELARQWPAQFSGGDRQIVMEGLNIVLWLGLSDEGCDLFDELSRRHKVEPAPSGALVYMTDGAMLNLPLVKRPKKDHCYKKPHWLPVTFRRQPRV